MIPQIFKINFLVTAPKIHTGILWDLTLLFTILAAIYFFFVFYFRNRFKKRTAVRKKLKIQLSPMVSEFLFYQEYQGTKDEKNSYINQKIAIRELIKDKNSRDVLSEILLDLKKDVSGDTRKSLFKLYKDLDLDVEAFDKLKSWRWHRISQGMFELTQMQVLEAYIFISRFINDKRSVIRKQAEISTVTLTEEGISYFLDTTKYQISEWQQLKILEVLSNFEDFQPPKFAKWLTSKNKHVVLFALRLIKHYDQNDAEKAIISLIRHKNDHIKQEAISCIKKFNFEASRYALKTIFWKSSNNIKLVILDTIASFQNKEDIAFLEEVDRIDINFIIKSKALSAINTIKPGYVMPSENLEEFEGILPEINTSDENIKEVVDECMEVMIIENSNQKLETLDDVEKNEDISFDNSMHDNTPPEVLNFSEIVFNKNNETFTYPKEEFIEISLFADVEFVAKENRIEIFEINNTETLYINEYGTQDVSQVFQNTEVKEQIEIPNNYKNQIVTKEKLEPSQTFNSDYESIFKSLFNTSDDYCKLILLDEILEIGNYKEIVFLESLHNHHNAIIKNKAVLIKAKLLEKLTQSESTKFDAFENDDLLVAPNRSASIDNMLKKEIIVGAEQNNSEAFQNNNLLPLEFCFLLEKLEIKPAKPKPFNVLEVEFDVDFSENLNSFTIFNSNGIENVLELENGLRKEEHNFFHELLHFPSKLKDKLNG